MKQNLHLLFVAFILMSFYSCTPKTELSSPDGHIKVAFATEPDGKMVYRVAVNDTLLLDNSSLGFEAKDGIDLNQGFRVVKTTFTDKDETWTQPWGENKTNRNHYNEMAVFLKNDANIELTLRFRAFDDGIAFRYEYEVPGVDSLLVTDELTAFRFHEDGISWSIPASFETYELLYSEQKISEVKNANTPFTFKTPGGIYGSIHEAALYDFPEMTLKQDGGHALKSELASWPDGIKARKGNNFMTSWRTIQIAPAAVGLINSSLILNLNEPCKLETTDWIKPIKYVGVWWGMHLGVETWKMDDRHGATTANAKKHIDFAHDNNIEGVLFEGWNEGWESWGGMQNFDFTKPYADFDIDEIVRYAREKNVQIIGHHETGGNIPNYERQMEKAIKWYTEKGIHILKTGYAGAFPDGHSHHGQYGVNHYQKVVETAARYHMTLDAHEPIKDTGIRRTWPNMMTREGARGMEWNAWSEGNPPSHHEMLPFTRLLGGPMDYTPGAMLSMQPEIYRSERPNSASIGTRAYQMGLFIIFESGIQMMADNPTLYYRNDECTRFITQVPQTWDETIALKAKVGEYAIVAKRKGDKWYIGGMTNNREQQRDFELNLNFLKEGQTYRMTSFEDGINANRQAMDYRMKERTLRKGDKLTISLARNGGFAAVIE